MHGISGVFGLVSSIVVVCFIAIAGASYSGMALRLASRDSGDGAPDRRKLSSFVLEDDQGILSSETTNNIHGLRRSRVLQLYDDAGSIERSADGAMAARLIIFDISPDAPAADALGIWHQVHGRRGHPVQDARQ